MATLFSAQCIVNTLNDRQRAIFTGRVVNELIGSDKRCATTFGVTKQRVGQIEKNLRLKLQSHFTRHLGADSIKDIIRATF